MSSDEKKHADGFRSGVLTTEGFDGWPEEIVQEFKDNEFNGSIGTSLVFENDSVRVWHLELEPGERMPVHRHVLTYFWTALAPGRFLQRTHDGTTYESEFPAFETHFYDVGEGEYALHNLENVGETAMAFIAVELKKESHNKPLPVSPGKQFDTVYHIGHSGPREHDGYREKTASGKDAFRKQFAERRRQFRQGIGRR